MKGQIFTIISLLAVMAYFVPLLIVLVKRLWGITAFILFALYWLIGGIVNVVDHIPGVDIAFRATLGAFYNMIDIPIILAIFYFTSGSDRIRQFAKYTCLSFLLIEMVNAYFKGVNYEAIKYVLGLGVLLVLIIVIWEIIFYLKKMEHTAKEKAMMCIYSALLFEYGTYIIIYIFDYYIKGSDANDNLLIYYISSLIAIVIASYGLMIRQRKSGFTRFYKY
ncbi:MAG TPA: hypothetical protein VM012_15415 [Flavitalea sp.]|nr:hypothetical protein [Flavitalea sp.]